MVRLCVIGFFLLAASADAALGSGRAEQKVTPVEKVIELLKKLESQVEAEGKKEAADYDKFACFCKDQADEKIYNQEKSNAKIKKLSAKIEELAGEISTLESDIGDLTKQIKDLNTDIDAITKKRSGDHDDYLGRNKELVDAISAIVRAIAALKDSRGNMAGDSDTDFAQLQATALQLIELSSLVAPTASQMSVLSQLSAPGKPHAFKFQSNDIIATLEDLKKTFKANKAENDEAEFRSKSASDKKKLSKSNEKKFAEQDKAEKEALSADKSDEKATAEEDRQNERTMVNNDQAFLDELTTTCETRAQQWDQRSSMRADELTALSGAMEKLEEGVKPNYDANKKLVGLAQRSTRPVSGHWTWVQDAPTSFLQVRRGSSAEVTDKALQLLQRAAGRLHSPVLSMAALKVEATKDHFKKVRDLLKDLIAKLKADAKAEAQQQGMCVVQMGKATASRDTSNGIIEEKTGDISKANADTATLKSEIQDLEKQNAEDTKAILEATELRDANKADNEKTLEDAAAGEKAVEDALTILKTFYENAFIQTGYTPPGADRSGKSVSDMAPDTFSDTYHGNQGQSKGIIGIMEVIQSDFERTQEKTDAAETKAAADHDKFEKDTNTDIDNRSKNVRRKNREISGLKQNLVTFTDEKKDAQKVLALALKELEKLEPMCVKGEETYAERVAAREQEIQALKDAMDILIAWKGF